MCSIDWQTNHRLCQRPGCVNKRNRFNWRYYNVGSKFTNDTMTTDIKIMLTLLLSLLTLSSFGQSNSEQFKKQVLENEYLDNVDIKAEITRTHLKNSKIGLFG